MLPPLPLWHRAAALAARAHGGQHRRDGQTPYAAHPARVAMIVATVFGETDDEILAAAYLHDVIEDTTVDYDDLLEQFGERVARLVATLSKDKRMEETEREAAYDRQLAAGPWEARLIKLADVYDNLLDAETDSARRRLLSRVHRALDMAGDAQLKTAAGIVRGLAETYGAELGC